MTVFIQIGNSDDKLTQRQWSSFVAETRRAVEKYGMLIGEWHSRPDQPWQNACWMVNDLNPAERTWLKDGLSKLAHAFEQDSIAYSECESTKFIAGKVA